MIIQDHEVKQLLDQISEDSVVQITHDGGIQIGWNCKHCGQESNEAWVIFHKDGCIMNLVEKLAEECAF